MVNHSKAVKLAALLLAASGAVFAQFQSLTTTADGSRLFFVSAQVQTGTDQPGRGKLFVAENGTIRPVVALNSAESFPFGQIQCSGPDNVVSASVAVDGSHISYTATRSCVGGTPRGEEPGLPVSLVYDSAGREVVRANGRMALSPNGLWGVTTRKGWDSPWSSYEIVDVSRGLSRFALPTLGVNYLWQTDVANNGSFVLSNPQLTVFSADCSGRDCSGGGRARVLDQSPARAAVISADGTTVVALNSANELRLYRLTGSGVVPRSLGTLRGDVEFVVQLKMSADARRVAWLARPAGSGVQQVFAVDTETGTHRQLTSLPEGVDSFTLSGDGSVLWFASGTGALMRLDIEKGALSSVSGPLRGIRPGYQYQVAAGQALTLPTYGEPTAVTIDGKLAPVLSFGDRSITIQVPWEASGTVRIRTQDAATRDWEVVDGILIVREYWPSAAESADGKRNLIAHQQFERLVTPENPARPGEVVHIYATGLGPVNARTVTGEPAPSSPLPSLRGPFVCRSYAASMPVLYAGLAPGTVGYYQVSVRLPADVQGPDVTFSCGSPDAHPSIYPMLEVTVSVGK